MSVFEKMKIFGALKGHGVEVRRPPVRQVQGEVGPPGGVSPMVLAPRVGQAAP